MRDAYLKLGLIMALTLGTVVAVYITDVAQEKRVTADWKERVYKEAKRVTFLEAEAVKLRARLAVREAAQIAAVRLDAEKLDDAASLASCQPAKAAACAAPKTVIREKVITVKSSCPKPPLPWVCALFMEN